MNCFAELLLKSCAIFKEQKHSRGRRLVNVIKPPTNTFFKERVCRSEVSKKQRWYRVNTPFAGK